MYGFHGRLLDIDLSQRAKFMARTCGAAPARVPRRPWLGHKPALRLRASGS